MIGTGKLNSSFSRTGRPAALLAAGVAWALCLPYYAVAQSGFSGPGRYEITNVKSGKVIDLDRNDQTTVIQFSSRGTDNQVWEVRSAGSGYYYLLNQMNGNALETTGTRNSSPVRAQRYNGSASQQWRIDRGRDGNALIASRGGKTLDIPNSTNDDGARVQIYDSNGNSNQQFAFRQVAISDSTAGWGTNTGGRNRGYGSARNRNNDAETITCSSNDGRRVYCSADTRGGVHMLRSLSGSSCREGSTWGYDSQGIWVDRGCRAEFQVSGETSGTLDSQFRGMDADNDGVITRTEWRGNDQSFRQHDRNGDGVLSGAEVQSQDQRDDRGRGRRQQR